MQMVHHISEAGAQPQKIFNGAHVFSSLNRKMLAPVDNKGNARMFHFNIEVLSGSPNYAYFKTANTGYVTKQAVKAWYKVWRRHLREAGVSLKDLGPYGSVFKPKLKAVGSLLGSEAEVGRGMWNYTQMVWTPPVDKTDTTALSGEDLSNKFDLCLTGDTVESSDSDIDTRQYTSVGMIESWLKSRKKPHGSDDADTAVPETEIFDQDNPLHLLRGGNALTSESFLDEVRDMQADKPPYTEEDLDGLYLQSIARSDGNLTGYASVSAPCGLIEVTTSAASELLITLTGITDM